MTFAMNYQEIQEALAKLARLSNELEEKYIENEGEVTNETEGMEAEKSAIQDLLSGEGIDSLGRWLKSKEDELKTFKAEKEAAARRMKSVENTIDFVKDTITQVMMATDQQKVKGVFYAFTSTVSKTTKVDTDLLNERYQDLAERAIRAAGVPSYVTMKLDAKVSLVPEGAEVPEVFITTEKDTVRFTKPRGGKE